MELSVEHKNDIERIMKGMECPKDFECWRSSFEKLCKVRKLANGMVPQCLEEGPIPCRLAVDYGYGRFCKCPVRIFAMQELGI